MDVFELTKENLKNVPAAKFGKSEIFDSLIIVPSEEIHDSGFRCMNFIGCKNGKIIERYCTGSDVLNIDGIGGYGKWSFEIPCELPIRGWSIDCLPNGFLRLFSTRCGIEIDKFNCSNFQIYGVEKG